MKTDWSKIEAARYNEGIYQSNPGDTFGLFKFKLADRLGLLVIASSGDDDVPWEHVSVSGFGPAKGMRFIPKWSHMCQIKDFFWNDDECVVQFHPPKSDYVNTCEFCLHLWKP